MPGSLRNTWQYWLRKKSSPLLLYLLFAIIFGVSVGLDFLVIKSIEILTDSIKSPPIKNVDEVNQYHVVLKIFDVFHGLSYVGLLCTGGLIFVYLMAIYLKILKKQPAKCTLEELLEHVRTSLIGIITINLGYAGLIWFIFLMNFALTLPLFLFFFVIPILAFIYIVTVLLLLIYASLELLCIYTEFW